MSNLRYDPVHDLSNDTTVLEGNSTTVVSPPKSDKVPISSLLAQDEEDAYEEEIEEEEEDDDDEEEAEGNRKVPSKRVILAKKRKSKEQQQGEPKPLVKKRKRETKEVVIDTNPIHKSKHLKKPDSEPLWRQDIQHDFLQSLLTNNLKIFRNPFGKVDEDIKYWSKISDTEQSLQYDDKLTFFQLYLLSILKSSRISKILKDRLIGDLNYAFKFIILCLLVNFGRLNTTINFDYEMRSQLRTYHCIPVLQIHHDIFDIASEPEDVVENNGGGSGYTLNSVKQLQDTPRLKTILKSVSDFNNTLHNDTYEVFVHTCKQVNLTDAVTDGLSGKFNLISLIFCLSQYEEQVMENFIKDRRFENDKRCTIFNEIFNLNNIKPENKVSRFLWLMYLFSETDLSIEGNLSNPFGETVDGENKIAKLEFGEEGLYNQDTPEELKFAEEMKLKRKNFLEIVENLSDNLENTTKDGKAKLNKKGRKKRLINDSNVPATTTTTVTTTSKNVAKQQLVKLEKLSPEEITLKKIIRRFAKEYILAQVHHLHEKRMRLGNLQYFKSLDLGDLELELGHDVLKDYNEFKLTYTQLLTVIQEAHLAPEDKEQGQLNLVVNDLF